MAGVRDGGGLCCTISGLQCKGGLIIQVGNNMAVLNRSLDRNPSFLGRNCAYTPNYAMGLKKLATNLFVSELFILSYITSSMVLYFCSSLNRLFFSVDVSNPFSTVKGEGSRRTSTGTSQPGKEFSVAVSRISFRSCSLTLGDWHSSWKSETIEKVNQAYHQSIQITFAIFMQ